MKTWEKWALALTATGIPLGGLLVKEVRCSIGLDECTEAPSPLPEEVQIAPPVADLLVGQTLQFSAAPRTATGKLIPNIQIGWSSSNPAAVAVSAAGLVVARSPGMNLIITATAAGVKGTARVSVHKDKAASVSIEPSGVELAVGQTIQLVASVRTLAGLSDAGYRPIWRSSDPEVASVSELGLVTARLAGLTTVSAAAEEAVGRVTVAVRREVPVDSSGAPLRTEAEYMAEAARTLRPGERIVVLDSLLRPPLANSGVLAVNTEIAGPHRRITALARATVLVVGESADSFYVSYRFGMETLTGSVPRTAVLRDRATMEKWYKIRTASGEIGFVRASEIVSR